MTEFEQKMLPPLMAMAEDKVPNVRLIVGKCLYKCSQCGESAVDGRELVIKEEVVLIYRFAPPVAFFTDSLERRLTVEMVLKQLEQDPDRDVRESTNATQVTDDSRMDETLANRVMYLDETIECEPIGAGSVPEVVLVDEDNKEEEEEKEAQDGDEQPNQTGTGSGPDEPAADEPLP